MGNYNFIELFSALFNATRSDIGVVEPEQDEVSISPFTGIPKKKKKILTEEEKTIIAHRDYIRKCIQDCWELFPVNENGNPEPITFDFLWNFVDFLHAADMIIFYPNTHDKKVYAPLSKNKEDKKTIIFHEEGYYTITVNLERVEDPGYSAFSNSTDRFLDAIKIMIERNYREETEYIVTSDVYLNSIVYKNPEINNPIDHMISTMYANSLSDLMYNECLEVFKNIINSLTSKYNLFM